MGVLIIPPSPIYPFLAPPPRPRFSPLLIPPIAPKPRLCALIGNPVEHSLSPAIHNAAFQHLGLNFAYVAFKVEEDRKSTRLNSSHGYISYAVFCLKKKIYVE